MIILAEGLMYHENLNKIIYSNEYIMNSGFNLKKISESLGIYAEYISDDELDLLYARSLNVKVFDDSVLENDYSLKEEINLDFEIQSLKEKDNVDADILEDEYEFIKNKTHNVLLLKIAFILKKHLDKTSSGVYLMRGSGIASYIMYAIGLNKVNPQKFGLNYKDFWDN